MVNCAAGEHGLLSSLQGQCTMSRVEEGATFSPTWVVFVRCTLLPKRLMHSELGLDLLALRWGVRLYPHALLLSIGMSLVSRR